MINNDSFANAFGSLSNAAKRIGCSRRAIYDWIELGYIPKICTRGLAAGQNWHAIIRKLGFNPENLRRIDDESMFSKKWTKNELSLGDKWKESVKGE